MTCPPYLTRVERIVAEKTLRAAGWMPEGGTGQNVWIYGREIPLRRLDLREVFPYPTSAQHACTCWHGPIGITSVRGCPVHGEGA